MNILSILGYQKSAVNPETKPSQTLKSTVFNNLCLGRVSSCMFAGDNPGGGEMGEVTLGGLNTTESVNFNTGCQPSPRRLFLNKY